MLKSMKVIAALNIGLVLMLGYAGTSRAQNAVTAIDIALEPDATMIQHAQTDNAPPAQGVSEGLCSGCDAPPAYFNVAAVCPNG